MLFVADRESRPKLAGIPSCLREAIAIAPGRMQAEFR
jgi:hypothetical protein